MKIVILQLLAALVVFPALAKTQKVFELYRTNYYTEKTMRYAVTLDSTCQLDSKNPVIVYFVDTKTKNYVEGFSKYNKEYFQPNILQIASEMAEFNFKSLKEVSKKAGSDYSILVETIKSGSQCKVNADLLKNGKVVVSGLNKVDAEFELNVLNQPKGFKWVKASGNQKFCLVGSCK